MHQCKHSPFEHTHFLYRRMNRLLLSYARSCNTIGSLYSCIGTSIEEAKHTYVIVRSFFEALAVASECGEVQASTMQFFCYCRQLQQHNNHQQLRNTTRLHAC